MAVRCSVARVGTSSRAARVGRDEQISQTTLTRHPLVVPRMVVAHVTMPAVVDAGCRQVAVFRRRLRRFSERNRNRSGAETGNNCIIHAVLYNSIHGILYDLRCPPETRSPGRPPARPAARPPGHDSVLVFDILIRLVYLLVVCLPT